MNKDKAYHQIALACLKVLKEGGNSSSEDQIKSLYKAIDQGFQTQFGLVLTELDDAKARLNYISRLDPEQHNLVDAQAIITQNKTSH